MSSLMSYIHISPTNPFDETYNLTPLLAETVFELWAGIITDISSPIENANSAFVLFLRYNFISDI